MLISSLSELLRLQGSVPLLFQGIMTEENDSAYFKTDPSLCLDECHFLERNVLDKSSLFFPYFTLNGKEMSVLKGLLLVRFKQKCQIGHKPDS